MLGDPIETRRLLFVCTDASRSSVTDRLPADGCCSTANDVTIVNQAIPTRNAVASPSPSQFDLGGISERRVTSNELTELGITISECIDEFEHRSGDLAPAELRVCFDSITPLLEHDERTLFQFLHILTGRIRSVNGMSHFHLPVPYESAIVSVVTPLFDAVIELRAIDGHPQQRWRLRDEDITTDWMIPRDDSAPNR